MTWNQDDLLVLPLASLDPLGARIAWPHIEDPERSVWVLRERGSWRAYENLCPHWRCPLDTHGGAVLDGGYLVCDVHGAEFRRADGRCVSGPCQGDSLTALHVEVVGDQLEIRVQNTIGARLASLDWAPSLAHWDDSDE